MVKYIGPVISIIVFIIWIVVSEDFSFACSRAISVLIISCPLVLGVYSYFAIKIGKRVADKSGIAFKSDKALVDAANTQIIALEMTGTVTEGHPVVTDINSADHFTMSGYAVGGYSDDELLEVAALLEKKSDHPIARSIIKFTDDILIEAEDELEDFKVYPGKGLEGSLDGILLRGGNLDFVAEKVNIPAEIKMRADELAAMGKTPIFYSKGKRLLGIISVADKIDKEAEKAIAEFKGLGIKVVMITGSNEETAKAIADKTGIDEVITGVLSESKEEIVRNIASQGKLAMVGKGRKDAMLLKAADIGFAQKDENVVLTEAADILLVNDSLFEAASAIRLSKLVNKKTKENYILLVVFGVILTMFASGVFYYAFGIMPGLVLCVILTALSCFLVFANSLRLNDFDINDTSKDSAISGNHGPENI